ncbi:MAG: cytochrome c3 family protein, partial [Candidatus Deferrimicrobiaceae bacterium]
MAAAAALLAFTPSSPWARGNSDCLDCHGSSDILSWSAGEKESNVTPGGPERPHRSISPFPGTSLFVDPAAYQGSVHADLSCTDCHQDAQGVPHTARLKPVDCSGCHSKETAVYAKSRHVVGRKAMVGIDAPQCTDCHGAHAISNTTLSTSPVYFRNIAAT